MFIADDFDKDIVAMYSIDRNNLMNAGIKPPDLQHGTCILVHTCGVNEYRVLYYRQHEWCELWDGEYVPCDAAIHYWCYLN